MRSSIFRLLLILLASFSMQAKPVYAAEEPGRDTEMSTASVMAEQEALQPPSAYGYIYIGQRETADNPGQLEGVNYAGGDYEIGIGAGRYLNERFSVDVAYEGWRDDYQRIGGAPIPGTANNAIRILANGLSVTGRYNYMQGRFHGYLAAGLAFFNAILFVTHPDDALFTTEGAPSSKWLPSYHIAIGADMKVAGNSSLGFELRERTLKADFGAYTHGEVDLGGRAFLLYYRYAQ